jgi:hypothetical protein
MEATIMYFRKFPRQILLILLTAALMLTACNVGAAPSPTLDVNAINTAIVGTTMAQFSAQFTQTALAVPPATDTPLPTFALPTDTPQELPTFALPTADTGALPTVSFEISPTTDAAATPLPAFTQLPTAAPAATQSLGDACNNSVFEGDVTIPDGTVVQGGETLQKVWKLRNTGTCTWDEGFTLVFIGGSIQNDNVSNFDFQSKDSVKGGEAIDIGIWFNAPCAQGNQEGHWRMRNDAGYYFGTILSLYITVEGKTGGCK